MQDNSATATKDYCEIIFIGGAQCSWVSKTVLVHRVVISLVASFGQYLKILN